jgi:hypothetical protein
MVKIERTEVEYATAGIFIILAWFLWLRNVIAPFLQSVHPFIAMLIYQIGLLAGLFLIANILVEKKGNILPLSLSAFLIFIAVDIVVAPYMVSMDGNINTAVDYWYVSSDAGFAALYRLFLPKFLVWDSTYILTPIILGLVIPIIVSSPKQIKKALTGK